jgi:hypothetical protein
MTNKKNASMAAGEVVTLHGNYTPDLEKAACFLGKVDPDTERFTFQTYSESAEAIAERDPFRERTGDPNADPLGKKFHGTLDELAPELSRRQRQGAGIYVTINETDFKGRKKENIVRVRCLYVDNDTPDPHGKQLFYLRNVLPPDFVVSSSPNKWHAYWRVNDCALDEFTALQKLLIQKFGTDPQVHGLNRVMRLPGFYHLKPEGAGPYLVHMLEGI